MPHLKSPVDLFRELLAMTPAERENYLTNRPPGIRDRILAKVREYEALDPNERELRLRATELRWYLLPLMHESPTNRAARLAAIPDDLRPLVKNRLQQWDILPPPLQDGISGERARPALFHARGLVQQPADAADAAGPKMASTARAAPIWRTGTRFPKTSARKSPPNSTGFLN